MDTPYEYRSGVNRSDRDGQGSTRVDDGAVVRTLGAYPVLRDHPTIDPVTPTRAIPSWLAILVLVGGLLAGCGGGLSREEDAWCGYHLDEVKRAIPADRQRDYGYMDDTWKDACRRAFAQR